MKLLYGDEEDDENLDDEIMCNFYFGGGEFELILKWGDGEYDVDASERRKSKKDVMEEFIVKSKFYKVEK